MKRTTGANREMAIVIEGDDSAKDRPAEKRVKAEEEAVPSQEVLELRQKVAKLEKEKQGAIRIAGEAQARVEFLESLIDKKLAASAGDVPEVAKKRSAINRSAGLATQLRAEDSRCINGPEISEIRMRNRQRDVETIAAFAARQAAQNEGEQQQEQSQVLNAQPPPLTLRLQHPPAPAVDQQQQQQVQSDELGQAAQFPHETPRESDTQQIADDDVATAVEMDEDDSQSLNGRSMVPNFTLPIPIEPKKEKKEIKEEGSEKNHDDAPIEPREESIDQFQDHFPGNNEMNDEFDPILGEDNNDISLIIDEVDGTERDEIEGEDSSVATAIELEEVKDEKEMKKEKKKVVQSKKKTKSSNKGVSKSKSAKKIKKKAKKGKKRNATELKCPECEFRTRNVASWCDHLRIVHSSSPKLAGLALVCECGHESFSEKHSRKCHVYNCTLASRTIPNPTTPQCILCQKHPSSIGGYISHLHFWHNKSTLVKNGIYIKCSCGFAIFSDNSRARTEHVKKCTSRQFSLHKLA